MTATHTCCAGGTWYVDLAEEEMDHSFKVISILKTKFRICA